MKLDEKFQCKKCSHCCSTIQLDLEAQVLFPGYFNSAYILHCCKPSLTLFDWEAKEMNEEAEKQGINFKLMPYKLVYDTKTKTTIIMQYAVVHDVCPFLKFSQCSIYEKSTANLQAISAKRKRYNIRHNKHQLLNLQARHD